jgi:hypothetical protein
MKQLNAKPQVYAFFFEEMKTIAKEHGYNLCLHGSMARDLDLVAIPWTHTPSPPLRLIQSLDILLTGSSMSSSKDYMSSQGAGGRQRFVINLNRGEMLQHFTGDNDPKWYADISVTPFIVVEPWRIEEKHQLGYNWPCGYFEEDVIFAFFSSEDGSIGHYPDPETVLDRVGYLLKAAETFEQLMEIFQMYDRMQMEWCGGRDSDLDAKVMPLVESRLRNYFGRCCAGMLKKGPDYCQCLYRKRKKTK